MPRFCLHGVRCALTVLAALLLAISPAVPANVGDATVGVLLASDIHFNPFAEKRIVDRLAAAPVAGWSEIFAADRTAEVNGYGKDTGDALLESALAAMAGIRPAPSIVLIDGDFLAHSFRKLFNDAASDRGDEAYDRFVDKTIAYLALRLSQTFPDARILPAIGNNDSYCGDYRIEPSSPFLAHMASAFRPLARASVADFMRPFSEGGHYALDLPAAGIRLVVPNSVFWSTEYKNECDPKAMPLAQAELAWFQSELARPAPAGEHTWVATHIPPGIDVFASLHMPAPKPTYVDPLDVQVPAAIAAARSPVATVVAGHFHFAGFRLIPARGTQVPVVDLPAVSPIYGDAPAFVVAELSPRTGSIDDYTTYAARGLSLLGSVSPKSVTWAPGYRFSSSYGLHGVTGANVATLERRLLSDAALRSRYFENFASGSPVGQLVATPWHNYWCGSVALSPAAYTACLGQGEGSSPR